MHHGGRSGHARIAVVVKGGVGISVGGIAVSSLLLGNQLAPVDELDRALGLDLAMARVALHELCRGLEDRLRELGQRELLVVGLLRREREVDARVRHKVRF